MPRVWTLQLHVACLEFKKRACLRDAVIKVLLLGCDGARSRVSAIPQSLCSWFSRMPALALASGMALELELELQL